MATANEISQSIQSLRAETAADSVTPQRIGDLLQAIVDLIRALSMVPDTEVVNIMQQINNAVSTANAAQAAANTANTNAGNKLITQLKFEATAQLVTLTIKQQGHTALSVSVPVADASQAGIVLPATLQAISDAAELAAKNKLSNISLSYTSSGISLTFKDADGATLVTKTLPVATQSRAGLMTSADKTKLDGLPADGVAPINAAGRVPGQNAPQVMIRNITDQSGYFDEHPLQNGDFYFDAGNIIYHESASSEINMGPPSKNVVYCHVDSDILYRWTGSAFTPIKTNPNEGLEKRTITRFSAATKRYDIPSGIFARLNPSTDAVNINLLAPSSGIPFYRIQMDSGTFYDDNDNLIVDQINWPISLIWQDGPPSIDDIVDGYGVIVTIYETWASYMKF